MADDPSGKTDRSGSGTNPESQHAASALDGSDTASKGTAALPEAIEDTGTAQYPPLTIVGIGASAGGIEALGSFFDAMPSDSGCAFVVVLHLDPKRESHMASVLGAHTTMPVLQIEDGMQVLQNHIYVIAPDSYLKVRDGHLHLFVPSEPRGRRHPVDVLFRSLAVDRHERAIAVVLSGTGNNGTEGLKDIRAEGGMSLVQAPETAKFDGMPQSAIAAGMADHILAPADMPEIVLRYSRHGYVSTPANVETALPGQSTLGQVLDLIRAQAGHDFRDYKPSTLRRRIHRRLGLKQYETLDQYMGDLRASPDEAKALVGDLMISVTGFFRDADAWEVLADKVIAPLIAERESGATIRIWVAACSTGEEAYSLAMLVTEKAEAAGKRFELKVFATDAQEENLRVAREGVYPAAALTDLPPARVSRFFDKPDGAYRVSKELRDMVVFARQNLLSDPPFSRLDLVSCRNFLIYLEPRAQQKVIALCHFALQPDGHLFLGNAETLGKHEDLFVAVSKKWRIYRRRGPTRHDLLNYSPSHGVAQSRKAIETKALSEPHTPFAEVARLALLERYAPASVLVDRSGRVLHFHGATRDYLEQPSGEPTTDVLAMARFGLTSTLQAAIRDAISLKGSVTAKAQIGEGEAVRSISITVAPLSSASQTEGLLLISFTPLVSGASHPGVPDGAARLISDDQDIAELTAVRAELHHTIEHLETANEELKASNEEATSMNEELQSTNEELETSKEELQSFNEELNTVNSQLQHKIGELESATNDLNNLLAGSETATLFLDSNLRIKWFAPAIKQLFDLVQSDIGRPVSHFARKFKDENLLSDAEAVLQKLGTIEAEVPSDAGRWYLRRMLPYRTQDNRIAGVVVTFSDITDRKNAADEVNEARVYSEAIVQTIRQPLLILDGNLRVQSANPAFYNLFKVSKTATEGCLVYDLGDGEWDIPVLRALLLKVLSEDEDISDFEVDHDFGEIGHRWMVLNARNLSRGNGRDPLILLAIEDVTERNRADEHRNILVGELNHRIKNTMATVQAIASQTLSDSSTMADARTAFTSRLLAMARAHDMLTHENWSGADLLNVVKDTVEPHAGGAQDRFRIDGEHLQLSPSAALSLAMAFHELCTNAAKYGALSTVDGHVDIFWRVVGEGNDRRLKARWTETGGPPVTVPTKRGFGSRLVERALAMELGGEVRITFDTAGVVCTIDAPMPPGN